MQTELKLALFDLYFKKSGDPSDVEQLLAVVESIGLEPALARDVLDSGLYGKEVRADQALSQQQGITAVPAFIFNNKYMVSGGQPKETFVNVLQQLDQEASVNA